MDRKDAKTPVQYSSDSFLGVNLGVNPMVMFKFNELQFFYPVNVQLITNVCPFHPFLTFKE